MISLFLTKNPTIMCKIAPPPQKKKDRSLAFSFIYISCSFYSLIMKIIYVNSGAITFMSY